MFLAHLPVEVQTPILELLSFRSLVSLSLVNKETQNTVEPFLYADVTLTWGWEHPPGIVPLLRSLFDKPYRAQYVRRLSLKSDEIMDSRSRSDLEPPPIPVSIETLGEACVRIQSTGLPSVQEWMNELGAGAIDALMALLISMLPNLTFLYLTPLFTIDIPRLGQVLRCALNRPSTHTEYRLPKYLRLTEVVILPRFRYRYQRRASNIADVINFFSLPRVQHLSIFIDNPIETAWSMPQICSCLTSLELFCLRETRLEPLLASLKSLKKLHWYWHYQEGHNPHAGQETIELDKIVIALSQIKDTLTDLTIQAQITPATLPEKLVPELADFQGSLQGLGRLKKLKALNLPWAFLVKPPVEFTLESAPKLGELLPPSIENLTINDDLIWDDIFEIGQESFMYAMSNTVKNQQAFASLPNLKRIVLPIPCGGNADKVLADLRELSDWSGIDLVCEPDHRNWHYI
ncbi:hypothetical protein HJFPF1_02209 [Paramyrothecium foliicola]|nr:hypothetical protein HJFPF1_02209 [Paramyrothecium foliicola]